LDKHVIQINFQAGRLQMKSRSPKFPQIPTIHQSTAKTATGNGHLQPEIESNEYSNICGNPNGHESAIVSCSYSTLLVVLYECYVPLFNNNNNSVRTLS